MFQHSAKLGVDRHRHPAAQPDVTEQVVGAIRGMAFKDGQPTPAAHAFAKKAGVDVRKLERVSTPKGEYLSAKVTKKGRSAAEVLSEFLPRKSPPLLAEKHVLAKAERTLCTSRALAGGHAGWRSRSPGIRGHSRRKNFSRPSQLGKEHVEIAKPDAYSNALYEAKVMAQDARKMLITEQLKFTARLANGFVRPIIPCSTLL